MKRLTRLKELIEKGKHRDLNIIEEDEVIDLDNFIEKSLDKRLPIPNQFKSLSNEKRLDKIIFLLEKVDKTIQKAKDKK